MRCETCVHKKDPHYVYRVQRVPSTLEVLIYWDNDDQQHTHDPNTWTVEYRCTQGHRFQKKEFKQDCPVEGCMFNTSVRKEQRSEIFPGHRVH